MSQLLELTTNPADKLWRYPICKPLLKLALKTPVTPNQVTIFHTGLSLAAGVVICFGTPRAFVLAGVMFEVRSILDCLDGVLARAKQLSSPFGRALDQLGDTIGFLSLMAGGLVCFVRLYGFVIAPILVFLTVTVSACCTTAWDMFRRRFASLMAHGYDTTEDDYLILCRRYLEHKTAALYVSRAVSLFGLQMLSPHSLPRIRERARNHEWPRESEAPQVTATGRAIQEAAARNDPELRGMLVRVALVGGDNLIVILTVGLLLGHYLVAFPVVMVWGLLVWIYTAVTVGRYLQGGERMSAREV